MPSLTLTRLFPFALELGDIGIISTEGWGDMEWGDAWGGDEGAGSEDELLLTAVSPTALTITPV